MTGAQRVGYAHRMQKSLVAALASSLLILPALAHADVPSPDLSGCVGKKAGDACTRDDKSDGTCVTSTCSRNDYSHGPPPTPVSYDCVICGAKTTPTPTSTGTPTTAPTSTTTPGGSSSSCSFGGVATAIGPWALALVVPALLRLRRKRAS